MHPQTADSLNNLAGLLQAQGELAAAYPLFVRALRICKQILGPSHPTTAGSLNNLAGLYDVQGNLVTARLLFVRALCIFRTRLGPAHPSHVQCAPIWAHLMQRGCGNCSSRWGP